VSFGVFKSPKFVKRFYKNGLNSQFTTTILKGAFKFFHIDIFSLPNLAKFPMDDCHVSNVTNLKKKKTLYCSTLAGLTLIILFVKTLNPIFFLWRIWSTWWEKKKKKRVWSSQWVFFRGKMGPKLPDFEGWKKPNSP
jgi:hypothetical protein